MYENRPLDRMRLQPYEVPDGAVVRSELIQRLEGVASHRLTLVTAPAGFGKTWLVSEWLAHRMDYERCWVTVDTDDNDPVRLLTHLAQSIAGSHPDSSRLLLTQIADSSIGVTIVLETMLSALASTETDFVIVVDDAHLLESDESRAVIRHLIRELPPTLRMIVIGRRPPAVPLSRLRLAAEVLELTTDDLRCTVDEGVELVEGSLGLDLPREVIEALHDQTGGWIAGIRLAAAAASPQDDAKAIRRQFPPIVDVDAAGFEVVGDYLIEEALNHLEAPDRQFMLDTSILEILTGPLCDAITERSGSGRFLDALRQSGSFTMAVDVDSYRYHGIVRDALRATLHRTQPAREAELHRRAATWLHDHGDVVAGVRHALAARDVDVAADWVVEASADLMERGQVETLRHLVEAVDTASEETPLSLLTTWSYAVLFTNSDEATVDSVLERTRTSLRSLSPDVAEDQPWESIPEPMHESAEELANQLDITICGFRHGDVSQALEIVDGLAGEPSESGWIEAVAGWLLILQEQPARGQPLVEAWTDYAFTPQNPILAIQAVALAMNAMAELARGDLLRARVTADRASGLLASRGLEWMPQSATSSVPAGWVAWELGDLDRAEEAIYPAIERIDYIGETPSAVSAHVVAARIAWSRRQPGAAFDLLDAARVTRAGRRVAGPFLDWLDMERARLHLLDGDPDSARWVLTDWQTRSRREARTMREVLVLARLLAASGEDPSSVLDAIPVQLEVTDSHRIEMHKTRALAHLFRKESAEAQEQVTAAMRIASYTGHVQTFLDDAVHLGALYPNAVALSGHRLPLTVAGPGVDVGTSAPPHLAEPLTERELEVLSLLPSHYTYQGIADELMMSHNTVKSHLRAIYRKLDADRRSEAVDAARGLGLIA